MSRTTQFLFVFFCFYATSANSADVQKDPAKADLSQVSLYRPSRESGLSVWHNENERAGILIIGTSHSFDPNHIQHFELIRIYKQFKPTLVIVEGGNWPIEINQEQAILKGGEMGLVSFLASIDKVPYKTFEPDNLTQYRNMRTRYSAEQIKLYHIARLIPQYKQTLGKMDHLNVEVEQLLQSGDPLFAGANTAPKNLSELNAMLAELIPNLHDWQDFSYNDSAPIGRLNSTHKELLNQIATASNEFRDAKLISDLRQALQNGEQVIVVAGTAHMFPVMKEIDFDTLTKRPYTHAE